MSPGLPDRGLLLVGLELCFALMAFLRGRFAGAGSWSRG